MRRAREHAAAPRDAASEASPGSSTGRAAGGAGRASPLARGRDVRAAAELPAAPRGGCAGGIGRANVLPPSRLSGSLGARRPRGVALTPEGTWRLAAGTSGVSSPPVPALSLLRTKRRRRARVGAAGAGAATRCGSGDRAEPSAEAGGAEARRAACGCRRAGRSPGPRRRGGACSGVRRPGC